MIEHPPPTEATVKYLYAHAFRCAFDGCRRPLYRVDEQTGNRILNSRVCHINARRERGPRWDPSQSPEDNRSERNLVLMCLEHSSTIDDATTLSAYPAELLLQWKTKQLEDYDKVQQGWVIDAEMAQEAIQASFSNVELAVNDSTIILGGEGGNAAGAGGGGGGAIGRNARGGHGGEGGALVMTQIDLTNPSNADLHHMEIVVGKGGPGSSREGQRGQGGEDTVVNLYTGAGNLLGSIRAPGGVGGLSGSSDLPEGVVELSREEIGAGFRITTFMPANAAELRENLVFVLGGDWIRFNVPSIPYDSTWTVVCAARWRELHEGNSRGIFLSLISPRGRESLRFSLVIPAEFLRLRQCLWIQTIGAKLDSEGAWTLRAHSSGSTLAEVDLQVIVSN